jgi:hypothetical protein
VTAALAPARSKPAPAPQQAAHLANNVVSIPDSVSASDLSSLAQSPSRATGRVILEKPEELKSTLEHRLWVGSTTAALAGILCNGLAQVHDLGGAAVAGAALLAAYVTAGEEGVQGERKLSAAVWACTRLAELG